MSIINGEEFDRIFDKIIHPETLHKDVYWMSEANRNVYIENFLRENCYKVYYDNQLFYVLTDAYTNKLEKY